MAGEIAVDAVGGVCMGVEMADADLAHAVMSGHAGRARPGDRVVATEHDRDDPATRNLEHALLDGCSRRFPHAVGDHSVAEVHRRHVVEHLDLKVEVVGAGAIGQRAQRARAEPRARTVGRAAVPRRSDDRDVDPAGGQLVGICHPGQLAEGGQSLVRRPVGRSVVRHRQTLVPTTVDAGRQPWWGTAMAYVEDRLVYDADSHIHEPPGYAEDYADPSIRSELAERLATFRRPPVDEEIAKQRDPEFRAKDAEEILLRKNSLAV